MQNEKTQKMDQYEAVSTLIESDVSTHGRAFGSLMRTIGGIKYGQLMVVLPDGSTHVVQGDHPGPRAVLHVHRSRLARDVVFGGHVGAAEAYLRGDWDSPDLTALLELASLNEEEIGGHWQGSFWLRLLGRLKHTLNANTRRGSRRNIAYHYDLGNSFYKEWLDPSMTYSAACFDEGGLSLEHAQQAKYRQLAKLAGITAGSHVLEVGCGWGGFAELSAREFGAFVTGLTLSEEQLAFAESRLALAGLAHQTDIRLQDYRDVVGQYDAIVSIEMFEAVGERNWPVYFSKIYDRLKPGGRAALQVITIEDHRFPAYRKGADFIQRYIFPGGMLPCPSVLTERAEAAGLTQTSMRFFGSDYAETLKRWQRDFQHNWDRIERQGFDARFKRMWEYYLSYCEAGFRSGAINVVHVCFQKPA